MKYLLNFKNYEDKPLNDLWENSMVISLNQVKKLVEAFKQLKMRDNKDCLIFDKTWCKFRIPGEQYNYYILSDNPKEVEVTQ